MLKPRILVTRPLPQGTRTAAKLRESGYDPVLAPMLRIAPLTPPDIPDFGSVQAVLITSANGLDALARLTEQRGVKLLTVGDRTAETARSEGFSDVTSAAADGNALRERAAEALSPAAGPLVHIRGKDAAVTFGALRERGFAVSELIAYEAQPVPDLPPEAVSPPPDAALVYSARTAAALAAALHRTALDPAALSYIGISAAALAPLAPTKGRRIMAETPDETALLRALSTAFPAPIKK